MSPEKPNQSTPARKKSTTGQSSLSFSTLIDAEDICQIIKTCGDAKVQHFKLNGLEIDFVNLKDEQNLTFTEPTLSISTRSVPFSAEHEQSTDTSREEELEQLMISDPIRYEEMVLE